MEKSLKSLTIAAVLLGVMITFGIGSASGARVESAATTKTVNIGDSFFSRRSTTINLNDTIKFRWNNTRKRHNVNVRSGPVKFKSKTKKGRYTYFRMFGTKGTYKLNCTIHPGSMKTTVRVR